MSRGILHFALGLLVIGVGAYALLARRSADQVAAPAGAEAVDARELAALDALEAQLAALEADFQGVEDQRAIRDNEHQYTRGLDRHDNGLITDVFWPDAKVSYGTLVDIDEIADWANAGHAENAAHQHFLTTLNLDIDGDMAHEEGYIFFSSDMPRDTSFDTAGAPTPGRSVVGSHTTFGTGRYVNRYERRDGEWRMIVHEYVNDISVLLETVDLCATACLGRWDSSDISYMRPLSPVTVEERRQRAEQGRHPRSATLSSSNGAAQ